MMTLPGQRSRITIINRFAFSVFKCSFFFRIQIFKYIFVHSTQFLLETFAEKKQKKMLKIFVYF